MSLPGSGRTDQSHHTHRPWMRRALAALLALSIVAPAAGMANPGSPRHRPGSLGRVVKVLGTMAALAAPQGAAAFSAGPTAGTWGRFAPAERDVAKPAFVQPGPAGRRAE